MPTPQNWPVFAPPQWPAFTPPLTSRPWQLRCLLALIVKVALDLDALRRQARDRCRCHELPIGVQDEPIARPVEDDAWKFKVCCRKFTDAVRRRAFLLARVLNN